MQDQEKISPAKIGDSFPLVSPVTLFERWLLPFFNAGRVVVLHLNHVPQH